MRLLNIYTLQFQEFFEDEIPPYHILSHRWSRDEISYEEFCRERIPEKRGYHKVIDFCQFVRRRRRDGLISRKAANRLGAQRIMEEDMSDLAAHGFALEAGERRPLAGGDWVWVDTCCIDKRSSAELTEAINSMFKWYSASYECIVRLTDVASWEHFGMTSPYGKTDTNDRLEELRLAKRPQHRYRIDRKESPDRKMERHETVQWVLGSAMSSLKRSVWFTRGWTLQELLAPEIVVFCNSSWEVIGHVCKSDKCTRNMYAYGIHLTEVISGITSIPERFLGGEQPLYGASIAQRMSWASRRTTTRSEDQAYCLLGLFNVNMPMVYGEGRKAFRRLQLEIIQRSTDQSIFAWTEGDGLVPMFASSPAAFARSGRIIRIIRIGASTNPYAITNNGLQLRTKLYLSKSSTPHEGTRLMCLTCRDGVGSRVNIELVKGYDRYFRYISSPKPGERSSRPELGQLVEEEVIYVDTGVEDTNTAGELRRD